MRHYDRQSFNLSYEVAMRIKLFIGVMFLSAVCHSEEKLPFTLEPVQVSRVMETTALGYANGRKLISDPNGTMYFSAVSVAPNGAPGVCVMRTVRNSSTAQPTFETVWLENSNGAFVSASMHFASSLSAYGAGPFYVVWTGGNQTNFNDPKLAHQVRFARIETKSGMKVTEVGEPFTVTGFSDAYKPPFRESHLWQEYPSAFVSQDGELHVVWEARDKTRKTPNDALIPAIAYAVRTAAGKWSVNGDIENPPYLDVKSVGGAQYRPFIATDSQGTLHVLCYGEVYNNMQILYGQLVKGKFSGWTPIAASQTDQRHATMAIDDKGRVHVVWRELSRSNPQSYIAYSMRDSSGTWTPILHVDDTYRSGSTPNITVDETTAYVVWTAWTEGFENSDSQRNNGLPNDGDTVEGDLEFATKRFDQDHFSTPVPLTGGVGSYPRIARMGKTTPSKLAVIWTLGKECLPNSCVQIYFSEMATSKN
jgi:hypothetical protein